MPNLSNNILTKIQTSNLTVIENGSGSIVFNGTTATFEFTDLKLKIELLNDTSDTSPRYQLSGLPSQKEAVLKCFNFENTLGASTPSPIAFAKNPQTNIILYVNFALYKIGGTYVLHYTFLEGQE